MEISCFETKIGAGLPKCNRSFSLQLLIRSIIFTTVILLCAYSKGQLKRRPVKVLFPLTLHFRNVADTAIMSLDSTYTNPHGESFIVKNFRYYISRFSVTDTKGKITQLPPAYFLIDERKPESKSIFLQIPFQNIRAVHFFIGVDSIKNRSGVQTGALDPANGMFWTWNSGYIMAKLEGTSPASSAPQHGFTYHIGGFRTEENALRKVTLMLPVPVSLSAKKTGSITIAANCNAWFAGSTVLTIKDQPFCMNPGKLAMQIADNYAAMFSVVP